MVLAGYAVEFFDRHTLHRHPVGARKVMETDSHVAVKVFPDKDFIYIATGFDGLDYGMKAEYIFI